MDTIAINDVTPEAEIARLALSPGIRLDISGLSDLSRLPEHVYASLHSEAEALKAPNLRSATTIHSPHAVSVILPELVKVGTIYANAATHIHTPKLLSFDRIFAFNSARQFPACHDHSADLPPPRGAVEARLVISCRQQTTPISTTKHDRHTVSTAIGLILFAILLAATGICTGGAIFIAHRIFHSHDADPPAAEFEGHSNR